MVLEGRIAPGAGFPGRVGGVHGEDGRGAAAQERERTPLIRCGDRAATAAGRLGAANQVGVGDDSILQLFHDVAHRCSPHLFRGTWPENSPNKIQHCCHSLELTYVSNKALCQIVRDQYFDSVSSTNHTDSASSPPGSAEC